VELQRILIVRLSAIGDVIHTLPALAALRRAFPRAHITWIVESASGPLLQGHPLLDELIVYPRAYWRRRGYARSLPRAIPRFFSQMRKGRFDVAIDFQGLTKSSLIPWLGSIRKRIGYGGGDGREISQWFYTATVRPPDRIRHVVRRNLYLLTALGLAAADCESAEPEFPLPDFSAERATVDRKLEAQGIDRAKRMVFLNPGARWETKRWPAQYFGHLATLIVEKIGCDVMITWGPGDEPLVDAALAEIRRPARSLVHRAPPTTLREFAAMLDHCLVMVGGDTGPVHLAAARGVPVSAIYGGSDPERNGPVGPAPVRVIAERAVECHPCWKTRCDSPPPRCLTAIKPEVVLETMREILNLQDLQD